MLAITVPCFTGPVAYQLSEIDPPTLASTTEMMIRVRAASVNPIDVKKANGKSKFAVKEE